MEENILIDEIVNQPHTYVHTYVYVYLSEDVVKCLVVINYLASFKYIELGYSFVPLNLATTSNVDVHVYKELKDSAWMNTDKTMIGGEGQIVYINKNNNYSFVQNINT